MRLQVLRLPSFGEGEPRFALVLDQVPRPEVVRAEERAEPVRWNGAALVALRDAFEGSAKRLGAAGVLMFHDEVDVE